jgi:hypothetical protein
MREKATIRAGDRERGRERGVQYIIQAGRKRERGGLQYMERGERQGNLSAS